MSSGIKCLTSAVPRPGGPVHGERKGSNLGLSKAGKRARDDCLFCGALAANRRVPCLFAFLFSTSTPADCRVGTSESAVSSLSESRGKIVRSTPTFECFADNERESQSAGAGAEAGAPFAARARPLRYAHPLRLTASFAMLIPAHCARQPLPFQNGSHSFATG